MPAFRKAKISGRPPNLTEDIIKSIVNALRAGAYVETAAVVAGVPKQTYYQWLIRSHPYKSKKGRVIQPKPIYVALRHAVERAMEEAVMRDLMNIDKCAMGTPNYLKNAQGKLILDDKGNPQVEGYSMTPDWRASAWRLERRNPKTWGRFDRIEATGKDGEALVPPPVPAQVIFTLPMKTPVPEDANES